MNVETIFIPFDEELLPATKLTAGRISCFYEHGRLRYLKYGEAEVIRMIYFAVRDKEWKTVPYTIENEVIDVNESGFQISYTALHTMQDISLQVEVLIKAGENTISFKVTGEALSSFTKNRIGICIHHPIKECKGKDVTVLRVDGTEYNSKFPELIAPHQPLKDIKKMQYRIAESLCADLYFEGDIFETEDQRNWSDSSYKTYSTPLDILYPVLVNKGERVDQEFQLKTSGDRASKDEIETATEKRSPFPNIGYGCNIGEQLSDQEIPLLADLPFDHYRTEIYFDQAFWKKELDNRILEAKLLNTKLELILYFNDNYKQQLKSLLDALKESSFLVDSVLVLHSVAATSPPELLELVYREMKSMYSHIQIGYGTNGFFASLNRNQPSINSFDFVSFSLCPQVHASDTRSMIENLERQADLIETARSFAAEKKIHISPITFKIQSNIADRSDYDERQHRWFGALWTLATIKNLCQANHLTLYQVKGYRGILYDEQLSPLYRMLKSIKSFKPRWIIDNTSQQGPLPPSILLENEDGDRLEFIINKQNEQLNEL